MGTGIKHLVECHCILPQYKNFKEPKFHKFVVFSIIDDSDTCIPKIVNCNHCGAAHRVFDICKSEILVGNEDTRVTANREDFKISLPISLYELLCDYKMDVPDFEYAQYILDNELWGSTMVLSRDLIDEKIEGKVLKFVEKERFRVESFSHRETI